MSAYSPDPDERQRLMALYGPCEHCGAARFVDVAEADGYTMMALRCTSCHRPPR